MNTKEEGLYLIGEVAKICNISVKTLRYYDQIGLLQPEKVDGRNNYRYYSKIHMLYINIIKDLKSFGFSLQEIKMLLKREDLSILQEKLSMKLQDIIENIEAFESIQAKLERYIATVGQGKDILEDYDHIQYSAQPQYKIELKTIPPSQVLYTRYRCPCRPGIFIKRYSQLFSLIDQYKLHRMGSLMAVFHDRCTQFDHENADIEVCIEVAENRKDCPAIREFGGFMAATTLHRGKYADLVKGYQALMEWVQQNDYNVNGAAIEKYIIDAGSTSYEENYVTELILPVEKINKNEN